MKDLMNRVMKELENYEREYNKSCGVPEIDKNQKRVVAEAATSYVEGILTGVLFGFGTDEYKEVKDMIEDLDYEFLTGQTITGRTF
jgi:hypothetical protein